MDPSVLCNTNQACMKKPSHWVCSQKSALPWTNFAEGNNSNNNNDNMIIFRNCMYVCILGRQSSVVFSLAKSQSMLNLSYWSVLGASQCRVCKDSRGTQVTWCYCCPFIIRDVFLCSFYLQECQGLGWGRPTEVSPVQRYVYFSTSGCFTWGTVCKMWRCSKGI